MSSAHSMNARKCVHAQKPYPSQALNQSRSEKNESIKVREKGKREGDRKDRGQMADGKKNKPKPNEKKKISEEIKFFNLIYLLEERLNKVK